MICTDAAGRPVLYGPGSWTGISFEEFGGDDGKWYASKDEAELGKQEEEANYGSS